MRPGPSVEVTRSRNEIWIKKVLAMQTKQVI